MPDVGGVWCLFLGQVSVWHVCMCFRRFPVAQWTQGTRSQFWFKKNYKLEHQPQSWFLCLNSLAYSTEFEEPWWKPTNRSKKHCRGLKEEQVKGCFSWGSCVLGLSLQPGQETCKVSMLLCSVLHPGDAAFSPLTEGDPRETGPLWIRCGPCCHLLVQRKALQSRKRRQGMAFTHQDRRQTKFGK